MLQEDASLQSKGVSAGGTSALIFSLSVLFVQVLMTQFLFLSCDFLCFFFLLESLCDERANLPGWLKFFFFF